MVTLTQRQPRPLVHYDLKKDLLAGVLAGLGAGLIMALAIMIVFPLFLGRPPYFPVQVIGAAAFGDAALPGGFYAPSFIAGVFIHLVVALLWALPFGLLINRIEHNWVNALAVGLAIGVLSQVIDSTFLIPALFNALHGHNLWAENVPMGWSWAAHLVYGASFLLFLPIRRRMPDEHPSPR